MVGHLSLNAVDWPGQPALVLIAFYPYIEYRSEPNHGVKLNHSLQGDCQSVQRATGKLKLRGGVQRFKSLWAGFSVASLEELPSQGLICPVIE